jgi:hypothetical protein
MEALLGLRSCGRGETACQGVTEACPENLNASPEVMEAMVFTLEGSLGEVEATDLEANPEATAI